MADRHLWLAQLPNHRPAWLDELIRIKSHLDLRDHWWNLDVLGHGEGGRSALKRLRVGFGLQIVLFGFREVMPALQTVDEAAVNIEIAG